MDFGRRRRSNNNGDDFANLTQYDEMRTTPIDGANNGSAPFGGSDPFGAPPAQNSFGSNNPAPAYTSGGYADRPATPPQYGAQQTPYGAPQQPTYGSAPQTGYNAPSQTPYGGQTSYGANIYVTPIAAAEERPMVFYDGRVKGQYIYEYEDRLEFYQVSGGSMVHTATKYKIKR